MRAFLTFSALFASAYALLLGAGIALGFVVKAQTGYEKTLFDNVGFAVNVLSYAAAVIFAKHAAQRLLIPVRHLRKYVGQQVEPSRRRLLAVAFALLGVGIDRVYHAAASHHFTGDVAALATWRLVAIAAAYAWFAHLILGWRGKHEPATPQDAKRAAALLLREFQALSAGDKSVLISALQDPEPVMMTSKGSPNDRFWQKLAEWGWMEQTQLPDAFAKSPHGRTFVTWTVTPVGRRHILELVRAAS